MQLLAIQTGKPKLIIFNCNTGCPIIGQPFFAINHGVLMINMNDYEEKIFLNKENLIDKINPYDIYRHYITEKFIIGKRFSSPLREDKHPSFIIFNSKYNELFWKDFRFGSGDSIILVQKMFNLNYFEALSKIATDFNLRHIFINPKDVIKSNKDPVIYNKTEIEKEFVTIKIRSRKFNAYDYWFWNQFGITYKCLKKYNVVPITHYFINGSPIKASKLSYAYPEKKDGNITYKIYQPLSKAKWFNNHDYSVIQGWRQLPRRGSILIITSSLKDAMSIICTTDYCAVAPQAESVLMKPHILKKLNERFDNIYINYDNDYNKSENWGQLNAIKIIDKYDFIKNIIIPSEYKSKDYSDLVMNRGKDFASELLKTLINGIES
jgi:hypothetical protein